VRRFSPSPFRLRPGLPRVPRDPFEDGLSTRSALSAGKGGLSHPAARLVDRSSDCSRSPDGPGSRMLLEGAASRVPTASGSSFAAPRRTSPTSRPSGAHTPPEAEERLPLPGHTLCVSRPPAAPRAGSGPQANGMTTGAGQPRLFLRSRSWVCVNADPLPLWDGSIALAICLPRRLL